MNIQLFLSSVDQQRPFLTEGLPVESTFDAPGHCTEVPPERSANIFAPPDDLTQQPWALVVPSGDEGKRLLSLIEPLRQLRAGEQGFDPHIYEVAPGMNQLAAAKWIRTKYRDKVDRNEAKRPRYLALLGGPEFISWDFQQMLAGEAFVGRIAFDRPADYEAYVEKARRCAYACQISKANALFHTVYDKTMATTEADKYLMQPLIAMARKSRGTGTFHAENILTTALNSSNEKLEPSAAADSLLHNARLPASLLFSVSHGSGAPGKGWKSKADQKALQGAMSLGNGQLLTADDVRDKPFLPMGVWFFFACFGVGTPSRSAYLPWIRKLALLGEATAPIKALLHGLPHRGQPPFVAALPRAALANPEGPLAIVGHVDLAWSWSYIDYLAENTTSAGRSRAERFQGLIRTLVHGHRFGVAHAELMRAFRWVTAEITASYDEEVQAQRLTWKSTNAIDEQVRRANLWMHRQDSAAYVLLGDPAARLPIAKHPRGIRFFAPRSGNVTNHSAELERRTQNVMAILNRTTTIENVAARLHISPMEVKSWVEVFCEAGRQALGEDINQNSE